MEEISLVMVCLFVLMLAITLVLHFKAKGSYDEFIEPLDDEMYRLKPLFPISLYILDKMSFIYKLKYYRSLLMKTAELSGHRYSEYYLRIHFASKISLIILIALILQFFCVFIGVDVTFIGFSLVLLMLIFVLSDRELNQKVRERRFSIQLDFPDFLNKLTLLVNAGMTINKAFEKISSDNTKDRPLYGELLVTLGDIKGGKSVQQAYEDFARRCRIPEITKFIAVIIQNIGKGGTDLVSVLRLMAGDAFEMRKSAAKRLGEEASTKMLLPMMIMFFAILLIVATPAVLSMSVLN